MFKSYLAVIRQREYLLWANSVPASELSVQGLQLPTKPTPEGLLLLYRFCKTGIQPQQDTKDADLFAKELFYYRLLDVFAQVFNKGAEDNSKEKLMKTAIDKLVCRHNWETLCAHFFSFRIPVSTTGQISSTRSRRFWSSTHPRTLSRIVMGPLIHSFYAVFGTFALRPSRFIRVIFFITLLRPDFTCAMF
jgi:hypothetical protein